MPIDVPGQYRLGQQRDCDGMNPRGKEPATLQFSTPPQPYAENTISFQKKCPTQLHLFTFAVIFTCYSTFILSPSIQLPLGRLHRFQDFRALKDFFGRERGSSSTQGKSIGGRSNKTTTKAIEIGDERSREREIGGGSEWRPKS